MTIGYLIVTLISFSMVARDVEYLFPCLFRGLVLSFVGALIFASWFSSTNTSGTSVEFPGCSARTFHSAWSEGNCLSVSAGSHVVSSMRAPLSDQSALLGALFVVFSFSGQLPPVCWYSALQVPFGSVCPGFDFCLLISETVTLSITVQEAPPERDAAATGLSVLASLPSGMTGLPSLLSRV